MSDCNNCVVDCRKEMYEKMGTNCSAYIPTSSMRVPLLRHLMTDNRKALLCTKVLYEFGLSIKEGGKYPGFKLEIKK